MLFYKFFIVIHKNNIIVRAFYYLMVEKLQAKLYIFHEDVSCFFGNKVVSQEITK